jgi:hypothetical protein
VVEVPTLLEQVRDVAESGSASPGYSTDKEPTHVRFSNRAHYGVGRFGEHIGTTRKGANIHIYKDRLFIIPKSGKAYTIKLTPEQMKKAMSLIALMRQRSERWDNQKAASFLWNLL